MKTNSKTMRIMSLFMIMGLLSMVLFGVACREKGGGYPTAQPVATSSGGASFAPTMTPVPVVEVEEVKVEKETIMFHDGQWGSNWVHLAIVRYIIENGYEYDTQEVQGTTGTMKLTILEGDVHVNMETWRMNIPDWYNEHTASGALVDLAGTTDPQKMLPSGTKGQTIAVAGQGFYVPRYMVEGDAARGIEATAPNLKHVDDLAQYKHLFTDPNEPSKGAIYNCILGWQCQKIIRAKAFAYGLYDDFNIIEPGGSAALKAAVVGPYEAGEPFVSYYWQPTDVVNLRDLVMLDEPKWNKECDDALTAAVAEEPYESEIGCGFPIGDAHTTVNGDFYERQPHISEFLANYYVAPKPLAEAESYKMAADVDWIDVAIKYLRENKPVWAQWILDSNDDQTLAADIIAKIDAQLDREAATKEA